ncbi:MAG: thioredoxin family protein, partial [Acidobacteriia bacterium]|nr:thioredoxin family protein [Terriglobia bacterium]
MEHSISPGRNKACFRFLALAVCLLAAARVQAEQAVHWYASIAEASAQALPANRPLFIDFRADWCKPCLVMEKEVYATPDFQHAAQKYLLVRIDYDRETALARKFEVGGLPTIVVTDSYGNLLFRHEGYLGAKSLVGMASALPGDVSEFNRLQKILAGDKNNFGALEKMGSSLRTAGLFLTSGIYYAKAAQTREAKSNPELRATIWNETGLNLLDLMDGERAADIFAKCIKEFPNSKRKGEWTLNLARSYALLGEKGKERARKLLESWVRENSSSAEAREAQKILTS